MKSKKAAIGEGIINIYRILLIIIIAFVIIGVAAVFYEYYVDVKDVETRIMSRAVINCLAPEGVFNLDEFPRDKSGLILDYCNISNTERFYVELEVSCINESLGREKLSLYQGDSGALWVRQIFQSARTPDTLGTVERVRKYKQGYFEEVYPINCILKNQYTKGDVHLQVLLSYEF